MPAIVRRPGRWPGTSSWARNAAEAKQVVREIAAQHAVRYVVKSKSMPRGIGEIGLSRKANSMTLKRLWHVACLATVAATIACGGEPPSAPNPPSERSLEDVLGAYRAAYGLPAVAAAIVRSDGIEEAAAVGVRRLGFSDSVKLGDRFHIGSDTKGMVATVAGSLVEDGTLSWFLSPTDVFPELATTIHPDFRTITLRDLLMHRAGIQPYTTGAEWDAIPNFTGTPQEQRRAFAVRLLQGTPYGQPGQYQYSNAGYSIAGAILEQVTGQSWQLLLRQRLFDPMGMRTAGFGWPALSDPDQPWGHWVISGSLQPHPPDDEYQLSGIIAPAGDVHMSIEDFALFVQLHLRGLRGFDGMLTSETIRYLHQPVGSYALGWSVYPLLGQVVSSHNGSAGTFYATMAVGHSQDLAIVIMTNAGGSSAADASSILLTVLLNEYR